MSESIAVVHDFIRARRQATLAVSADDQPYTAMVSYAELEDISDLLIHLSALAPHKRMLQANPRCSLLIAEPDDGRAEVMSLPRVTLHGVARLLAKGSPEYEVAKARFLTKLPSSQIMFGLPDFDLFSIAPAGGRYIGGFGRAFTFTAEEFMQRG